jgi:hypothetical protein
MTRYYKAVVVYSNNYTIYMEVDGDLSAAQASLEGAFQAGYDPLEFCEGADVPKTRISSLEELIVPPDRDKIAITEDEVFAAPAVVTLFQGYVSWYDVYEGGTDFNPLTIHTTEESAQAAADVERDRILDLYGETCNARSYVLPVQVLP